MDAREALMKPPAKKPPVHQQPSTSTAADAETEAAAVQLNPGAELMDEIFADVNSNDDLWDFDFDQLDQQPNVRMFSI